MDQDFEIHIGNLRISSRYVSSFESKGDFVKCELKSHAFSDKDQATRAKLLEQVYDIAVPPSQKTKITKK